MSDKVLSFSFKYFTKGKITKEIKKLDSKKACQESDIPVKVIKKDLDVISPFIYNNLNNSLFSSFRTKKCKCDTYFRKKDQSNVENYRPESILPIFSKVYKRCMYDQMYEYFNKILSNQQCGF